MPLDPKFLSADTAYGSLMQGPFKAKWDGVTNHPFWRELAALPTTGEFRAKFQRYFCADYVFVEAFIALLANALARTPRFEVKKVIGAFLHGVLQGEATLFRQNITELYGTDPDALRHTAEPASTAKRMEAFLERIAYGTAYLDQIAVIAVAEGLYLHWASSVIAEGLVPAGGGDGSAPAGLDPHQKLFWQWIVPLHASPEFSAAINAIVAEFDTAYAAATEDQRAQAQGAITEMLELEWAFTDEVPEGRS